MCSAHSHTMKSDFRSNLVRQDRISDKNAVALQLFLFKMWPEVILNTGHARFFRWRMRIQNAHKDRRKY
jgi:hypothetical protein